MNGRPKLKSEITPHKQDGIAPLLQGEIAPRLQAVLHRGIIAALIAMLGIAAFAILSVIGAPFVLMVIATALFVGSSIYLAGIAYGIINDIIGCYKNLPYFSLGHQPGQRAVIESNKPLAVATAWGILATADLSLIAAGLFTTATLIAGFFVPIATFALPAIVILIPLAVVIAHIYSQYKENERQNRVYQENLRMTWRRDNYIEKAFNNIKRYSLDEYHRDRLDVMCTTLEEKNAWLGNSDRNIFGYIIMPITGIVSLVSIITLSAVSHLLPAILLSSLVATMVPVVAVGIVAIAIAAAITYMAINYYKQDDNKYKLDFDRAPERLIETSMNKDLMEALGVDAKPTAHVNPTAANDLESTASSAAQITNMPAPERSEDDKVSQISMHGAGY